MRPTRTAPKSTPASRQAKALLPASRRTSCPSPVLRMRPPWSSPWLSCTDVEIHRQGRGRQHGLVEGGEAGARVTSIVQVRLDRPHHRLPAVVDPGHVDELGDALLADERPERPATGRCRSATGHRRRVPRCRRPSPDARRWRPPPRSAQSSCWSSPLPREMSGPTSGDATSTTPASPPSAFETSASVELSRNKTEPRPGSVTATKLG